MIAFENDIDKYIVSRWMYSIAEPIISDAEYNALHRYLVEAGTIKEFTERSWSSDPCPTFLLKKYGLESKIYEVKLLDKTESIRSFTTETEIDQYYRSMNKLHIISYKIDGFNLQLTYYNGELLRANTRGRSADALDASNLMHLFPKNISIMGEVKIVGELNLTEKSFRDLQRMYPEKNLVSQRSSVRTAMANEDAHHLLSFLAFDVLKEGGSMSCSYTFYLLQEWGFKIPNYEIASSFEELQKVIKKMSEAVSMYPYPTDGLVVRSDVGRSLRAIRVNYWQEDIYYSYITGYEETFGPMRTGVKALIYNIKLPNSTQKRVNVTNFATIVDNNLFPNSPIAFRIVSEAIADLDLEVTRLLQRQWSGRYNAYKERIEMEEYIKEVQ